jgi:hypothetical protein
MGNTSAADLFGGPEQLAGRLVKFLQKNNVIRSLTANRTPLDVLSQISRQDLLDCLADDGACLDRVMQLTWKNDEVKAQWLARMNSAGTAAGVGSNGAIATDDFLLGMYVQLEALGEICKGETASKRMISKERKLHLREKYSREFGLKFS